ncbi:hypothetical protein EON66_07240 [archaeon]|nr:MAG: hypothetical protein EON66_07240 [archaeon]
MNAESLSTTLRTYVMAAACEFAFDSMELFVGKEDMKFSAAHFTLFGGGGGGGDDDATRPLPRERLHGHNYNVSLSVRSSASLNGQGMLLDFSVLKRATRRVCASLDEYTLLPAASPHAVFTTSGANTVCTLTDGTLFSLPSTDVRLLPVTNVTVEELARYVVSQLLQQLADEHGASMLTDAGVTHVHLSVRETAGQEGSVTVRCVPAAVCAPAHSGGSGDISSSA